MRTWLVQLVTRVLKHELASPLRMLPRKRQVAGPLLDEREVPESIGCVGLVPLSDRAQPTREGEPRLVDPPRPEEAVAPGCRRLLGRAGIARTSRKLQRSLRQGERLRLALVEADDGEYRERAGRERVAAESLSEPDCLACVPLRDVQTFGDPGVECELDVQLELELQWDVGLSEGFAQVLDSRAHARHRLDVPEQRKRLRSSRPGTRLLEQLVRELQAALRRPRRQLILRGADDTATPIVLPIRRGSSRRRLGELRRDRRRAARARESRCLLQRVGSLGIRRLERRRDVAGTSDRLIDHGGDEPVRATALGFGGLQDHARREQRMDEPDLPVREL